MEVWKNSKGEFLFKHEKQEIISSEFKNYVSAEYEYLYILFSAKGKILRMYSPLMSSEKEILSFSGYAVEGNYFFGIYAEMNYDTKEDGVKLSKSEELNNLTETDASKIPFANDINTILKERDNNNQMTTQTKLEKENNALEQLLDLLKGKENIHLTWDAEGTEDTSVWSLIKDKLTGKILWKSPAYYGESKRAEEIESFLKNHLGSSLKSFEINHNNDLCSLYFYTD